MDRHPLSTPFGPRPRASRCAIAVAVGMFSLGLLANGGCSWLERGKLARFESENDRLVKEFRAERTRSTVLDEQNQALGDRVAELESRLATVSDSLRGDAHSFGRESIVEQPPRTDSAAPPPQSTAELPPAISPLLRDPWRGRR